MDVPHFVYPLISWWTLGFLLLATASTAAVTTCVHVLVWAYVFSYHGYMITEWNFWVIW